jgi:small membrane protein
MFITVIQIALTLFLIFALSRVFLRFRGGDVTRVGFVFWVTAFSFAIAVVVYPELSSRIAKAIGVGRGSDAVVYGSIAVLYYLVFRLYVYLEDVRHEITALVRKIALKEKKRHE